MKLNDTRLNGYWTARLGRSVTEEEIKKLIGRYRRVNKVAQWEMRNRLTRFNGRMMLAYRVPGTPEAGIAAHHTVECERFIERELVNGGAE